MKSIFVVFLLSTLLVSCIHQIQVFHSEPKITEQEKAEAHDKISKCIITNTSLYDDGKTCPQGIVPSISSACYEEIDHLRLLLIRGQSDAFVYGFMSRWDGFKSFIMGYILLYRAENNNPSQPESYI